MSFRTVWTSVKVLAKDLTVSWLWGLIYFYYNTYSGFTAVTFQFTRIGNDPGAAQLLIDLDEDPDIREYLDVLPVEFGLENLSEDKWFVVCLDMLFSKCIFVETEAPLTFYI